MTALSRSLFTTMDQCNVCITANTAGNENYPFHTKNHGLRLRCNSLSSCFTLVCKQPNVSRSTLDDLQKQRRDPEAHKNSEQHLDSHGRRAQHPMR